MATASASATVVAAQTNEQGRPSAERVVATTTATTTAATTTTATAAATTKTTSHGQFACLYTKHKTQKHKVWQDGRLVIGPSSLRLHAAQPIDLRDSVLDECEITRRQADMFVSGDQDTIETEKFLITVDGPWIPPNQTSRAKNSRALGQTPLVSRKMQKVMTNKFRKPTPFVPPNRQGPTGRFGVQNQRRRPLQPGELQRRYYGSSTPAMSTPQPAPTSASMNESRSPDSTNTDTVGCTDSHWQQRQQPKDRFRRHDQVENDCGKIESMQHRGLPTVADDQRPQQNRFLHFSVSSDRNKDNVQQNIQASFSHETPPPPPFSGRRQPDSAAGSDSANQNDRRSPYGRLPSASSQTYQNEQEVDDGFVSNGFNKSAYYGAEEEEEEMEEDDDMGGGIRIAAHNDEKDKDREGKENYDDNGKEHVPLHGVFVPPHSVPGDRVGTSRRGEAGRKQTDMDDSFGSEENINPGGVLDTAVLPTQQDDNRQSEPMSTTTTTNADLLRLFGVGTVHDHDTEPDPSQRSDETPHQNPGPEDFVLPPTADASSSSSSSVEEGGANDDDLAAFDG